MPAATAHTNLWESAKTDLRGLFPEDVFQLWFDPVVCLESSADQLVLGVPNDFAAIWINDNYMDLIVQRLRLTAGREIKVVLRKIEQSTSPAANAGVEQPRVRPPVTRRIPRPAEEKLAVNTSLNP
ncbi:MAG: hypothetical protein RL376_356, partial [Verrucomicrobiota bacterium]